MHCRRRLCTDVSCFVSLQDHVTLREEVARVRSPGGKVQIGFDSRPPESDYPQGFK